MITHGKINGRATVNLKISILDSRTNHSSRLNWNWRIGLWDCFGDTDVSFIGYCQLGEKQ